MRHVALMGITGGVTFIAALIAFVLVPRQATRTAQVVSTPIEERPDTLAAARLRDRAGLQIAAADSVLGAARRLAAPVAFTPIDTFPPEAVARRDSLVAIISTLNRLIARVENAPLPSSYRALGESQLMAGDPSVRALLDSLTELERERDAFGAVGGVDPVYVALTTRATSIGRTIQSIAVGKRNGVRSEAALLRPAPPPALPRVSVDTARFVAERLNAQRVLVGAQQELANMRRKSLEIDQKSAQARNLANVNTPPLAMLAAASILALVMGFAVALGIELRIPHVADAREAEQVTGARVLTIVQPAEVIDRSRRQADVDAPPLIDIVSQAYRTLYLHLAATESTISIVTIAGDEPAIVAAVAANLAAAAAYEARSALLVDVDPSTSAVANVLRIRSDPGLSAVIAGTSSWPEAIVSTTIGRDRPLDVLPSGSRRTGAAGVAITPQVRSEFARLERRYDLIVIAAPTSYVQRGSTSIIPAPDIVYCARLARTSIKELRTAVESLRGVNMRVHGIVLWNDDLPQLEPLDAPSRPGESASAEMASAR